MQQFNAIVTDGLWRKSLSAIRSLGKAGFEVTVMGDSLFTTGFWSRYASHHVTAPTAALDREAFGEALLSALGRQPGAVILPMEDASLLWISENEERVRAAQGQVLLPPAESLRIAQDKSETLKIAQELKLSCPQTWRPATAADFAAMASALKRGTFVVKPRSGTGSAGVLYGEPPAGTEPGIEGAKAYWLSHWERFGPMLIQERVPPEGRGQGVSLLMNAEGDCVAAFVHERLEQYPNSGGPSTDRWGIHAPALVEQSIRLLKHLRWRGIAMVEWKVDPRTGQSKLMEINPRFWGSLELAVRSGIDFPSLYARATLGERFPPATEYPEHVRCRWMIPGEILRFLTKKEGRESVFAFLRGLPGLAEEWDASDVRGFFSVLVCTAALALNPRYWKYVLRG